MLQLLNPLGRMKPLKSIPYPVIYNDCSAWSNGPVEPMVVHVVLQNKKGKKNNNNHSQMQATL